MISNQPIRAAQYLRMSTDLQEYSLANQAAASRKYADSHGFVIVRKYEDAGRIGVVLRIRPPAAQWSDSAKTAKFYLTFFDGRK